MRVAEVFVRRRSLVKLWSIIGAAVVAVAAVVVAVIMLTGTKEYTVKFLANGGKLIHNGQEVEQVVQKVTSPDKIVAPEVVAPDEDHYFAGWDKKLTNITSDATVKATWGEYRMTITFVVRDGEYVSGEHVQKVNVGSQLVPPVYNRDGYTLGWDKDLSTLTETTTVNGVWESNEYEISFVGADGAVIEEFESAKVKYGQAVPTLPGGDDGEQRILGWKVFGSENEYVVKGQAWNYLEDKELEPVYGAMSDYRVYYDLAGGTQGEKLPLMLPNSGESVEVSDPTREGYYFTGWKRTDNNWQVVENLGKDVYLQKSNYSGDVYLVAKWSPIKFNVTFKTDIGEFEDGTNEKVIEVEFGSTITGIPTIVDTDAVFTNWTFGGYTITEGMTWSIHVDGDVDVVANFENSFRIYYDLSYNLKLRYSVRDPEASWTITEIDSNMYELKIIGKLAAGTPSTVAITNVEDLELPDFIITSPSSKIGEMDEFAFGGKWRYYTRTGDYIDFRQDGKILRYDSNGNYKEDLTHNAEKIENIFRQEQKVNGLHEITLHPYCIRDWS